MNLAHKLIHFLSGEASSLCSCKFRRVNRVLAWDSRWRSPIGLTQSDLMTSLAHGTADWFSPVSVANELTAQYSNTWLLFVVAVRRNPPPSPAPPVLICYEVICGVIHMRYMCSSSISFMLTAACCGCIGNSKSRYLLCRSSVADLFLQIH